VFDTISVKQTSRRSAIHGVFMCFNCINRKVCTMRKRIIDVSRSNLFFLHVHREVPK
jgi:hypothetical protein